MASPAVWLMSKHSMRRPARGSWARAEPGCAPVGPAAASQHAGGVLAQARRGGTKPARGVHQLGHDQVVGGQRGDADDIDILFGGQFDKSAWGVYPQCLDQRGTGFVHLAVFIVVAGLHRRCAPRGAKGRPQLAHVARVPVYRVQKQHRHRHAHQKEQPVQGQPPAQARRGHRGHAGHRVPAVEDRIGRGASAAALAQE